MVYLYRRLTAGYGIGVYILYGHRAISLTGFYNGPVQSHRYTVRRSYVDRAVIVLSPQPCTEIAQRPGAASVQRPCGDRTVAV